MSTSKSVLGVSGVCWVDMSNLTQAKCRVYMALRGSVSGVLGLRARARMSVVFLSLLDGLNFFHARTEKPNKPNTLNTNILKALNLKDCSCVGFVLGWAVLCWVGGEA